MLKINSGSWALLRPGPDPLGRRRCASCSGLLHVPVSHVLLFLVDVDLAIDSSLRWEAQVFLPAMADAQKAVAVAAHVGGRVSAHVTLEVTEAFPAAMRQMPTTLSGQRWS